MNRRTELEKSGFAKTFCKWWCLYDNDNRISYIRGALQVVNERSKVYDELVFLQQLARTLKTI